MVLACQGGPKWISLVASCAEKLRRDRNQSASTIQDILSTILNIIAAYADGLPWEWPQLFVVLLILLGPICGMMGASYLQRSSSSMGEP